MVNVIDFLDKGVADHPARCIVKDATRELSHSDFADLTHQIANAIDGAGLGPRARIATYAPNGALAYAAQYGVVRSGRIWVPLNVRNSVTENISVMNALHIEFLLIHSSFAEELSTILLECPTLRGVVCIDEQLSQAPALEKWIEGQPKKAAERRFRPDDVYAMLTTSGTTGLPKGVELTHLNFECMAASFNVQMPLRAPPVHLVVAPLTHAAGMFAGSLLTAGAINVILPKADPASILKAIQDYRVTTIFLPPTVIYMLLACDDIDKYDYSSLEYFVYGAAPMSAEKLVEGMRRFGNVFFQIFGQTEALMVMTTMTPSQHAEALEKPELSVRLKSCGKPAPYVALAVMDDQGLLLDSGQEGEIVVRGNIVMKGYYRNERATAEVSAHGWHHTGDIGRIDQDGYVYLVDRKKDMIVSGGFNVYPSEVEQVIWTHPAVQDCAVVGAPHEHWGEAVTAVVELKPGMNALPEEIMSLCKAQLGGVKAPKSVEIWEQLPRSSVGKVLKREIRAKFWAGRDRMIN
ncbi:MAG: o-succinylbenzoate--CoA ligase [Alcaligenaceae bacterium]|nr:MAG: o-succinylbenzoate--CoA ligase [Alcaligenaceae bacterium]